MRIRIPASWLWCRALTNRSPGGRGVRKRLSHTTVRRGEWNDQPAIASTNSRSASDWKRAQAGHLAFLANPRYAADLAQTAAGVVVLRSEHANACPVPVLIATDPYLAY